MKKVKLDNKTIVTIIGLTLAAAILVLLTAQSAKPSKVELSQTPTLSKSTAIARIINGTPTLTQAGATSKINGDTIVSVDATVTTDSQSQLVLIMPDNSVLLVDNNTRMKLLTLDYNNNGTSVYRLEAGRVYSIVGAVTGKKVTIGANIGKFKLTSVLGSFEVNEAAQQLWVEQGEVDVADDTRALGKVAEGQAVKLSSTSFKPQDVNIVDSNWLQLAGCVKDLVTASLTEKPELSDLQRSLKTMTACSSIAELEDNSTPAPQVGLEELLPQILSVSIMGSINDKYTDTYIECSWKQQRLASFEVGITDGTQDIVAPVAATGSPYRFGNIPLQTNKVYYCTVSGITDTGEKTKMLTSAAIAYDNSNGKITSPTAISNFNGNVSGAGMTAQISGGDVVVEYEVSRVNAGKTEYVSIADKAWKEQKSTYKAAVSNNGSNFSFNFGSNTYTVDSSFAGAKLELRLVNGKTGKVLDKVVLTL